MKNNKHKKWTREKNNNVKKNITRYEKIILCENYHKSISIIKIILRYTRWYINAAIFDKK